MLLMVVFLVPASAALNTLIERVVFRMYGFGCVHRDALVVSAGFSDVVCGLAVCSPVTWILCGLTLYDAVSSTERDVSHAGHLSGTMAGGRVHGGVSCSSTHDANFSRCHTPFHQRKCRVVQRTSWGDWRTAQCSGAVQKQHGRKKRPITKYAGSDVHRRSRRPKLLFLKDIFR